MSEVRDYRIDPAYGNHVTLYCTDHPDLRWHTKNIDFIGARRIFFAGSRADGVIDLTAQECECPGSMLEVLPCVQM